MPQAMPSTASSNTTAGRLSTVVYRSRAALPLSYRDLHQLTVAAQARNRVESITGVMLYDDSHFFQWLEGPSDSVDRIMQSIRSDPRHTDIEVFHSRPLHTRVFGDWNMKFAMQGPAAESWRDEVLEPPPEIVEGLRRRPEAAPVLLVKLVALDADRAVVTASAVQETTEPVSLKQTGAAVLERVFLSSVVPTLLERQRCPPQQTEICPVHGQAGELASLLIAADQTAARVLIAQLRAHEETVWPLYATLFEPVARILGDRWSNDDCSEFDVTLGLSRLQTAVRQLCLDEPSCAAGLAYEPVVLIAPEPGELHGLGAALDSEMLWHAGWNPHCEYPDNDKALQDLLAATWFDALDLSLSVAFRREAELSRLATTIAHARRASCNPALAVIVGGRIFVDQNNVTLKVGADYGCTTALHIERAVRQGMVRQATTNRSGQPERRANPASGRHDRGAPIGIA
jgi:methanogenic corrinoid protein MtbC1